MERLQKERDELLAVTPEIIQGLGRQVAAFMRQDYICVVGNGNKLKESKRAVYEHGTVIPVLRNSSEALLNMYTEKLAVSSRLDGGTRYGQAVTICGDYLSETREE